MAGADIYAPRTENQRRTWTIGVLVLTLVFLVIGVVGAVLLWNLLGGAKMTADHAANAASSTQVRQAFGTGAQFGLALIPLFLWIRYFERGGLGTIGLRGNPVMPFLRGAAIGLVCLSCAVGGVVLLGGYRIISPGVWATPTLTSILPLVWFGLAYISQGSTEEIFLRGWLLQTTASRYGRRAAIVVTAVYFSVLHAANIDPAPELGIALVNLALMSVFLSVYAIDQGFLWGACGWHAAWNWTMASGFGLDVSGGGGAKSSALIANLGDVKGASWWLTGGAFGPEGSVVATAVLLAACLWAFAHRRRNGSA